MVRRTEDFQFGTVQKSESSGKTMGGSFTVEHKRNTTRTYPRISGTSWLCGSVPGGNWNFQSASGARGQARDSDQPDQVRQGCAQAHPHLRRHGSRQAVHHDVAGDPDFRGLGTLQTVSGVDDMVHASGSCLCDTVNFTNGW